MDDEGTLTPTVLYLACTRPGMKWGVPAEGFLINLACAYLVFLVYGHANIISVRGATSLLWWPVGHLTMRALVEIDHNIFRLLVLKMATSGIRPFGVTRLWPMSSYRASKARELASGV